MPNTPQIIVSAGKGGVGKTLCSTSLAVHFSRSSPTALIDQDGGHSVARTLGLTEKLPHNELVEVIPNLRCLVVENYKFVSINAAKKAGWTFERYMSQFPEDFGYLALADMPFDFFGIPTDVILLQKFLVLVHAFHRLKNEGVKRIIIDVEPTAGLERLLVNAQTTARSLRNLNNQGRIKMGLVGVAWPEIAAYIASEYIANIETYIARFEEAVARLVDAIFLVVTTPKTLPVEQAFEIQAKVAGLGGRVHAYVVNDMRGAAYESRNIALLEGGIKRTPYLLVGHYDQLEESHGRIELLGEIGKKLSDLVPNGL